jgi:general secretion pathway protein K
MPMRDKHERGAALLTVLMVIALGSVVAAALLTRESVSIERSQRYFEALQAEQYAMGAELLARQRLHAGTAPPGADGNPRADIDAAPLTPDGSRVTVHLAIEDMQGRFNLNSLAEDDAERKATFDRLLGKLAIDPRAVPAVMRAAANTPQLAEASELMEHGMDAASYSRLAPYIAALPSIRASIDVNAASENLLEASVPDEAVRRAIVEHRAAGGRALTDEDLQQLGLTPGSPLDAEGRFFQVEATVTSHGREFHWRSLIVRRQGTDGGVTLETVKRALNREGNPITAY